MNQEAFCSLEPQMVRTEPDVTEWLGLTTLLLDHNGLTNLDPCITERIWTVSHFHISGNPLSCDCSLLTLRDFAIEAYFPGAQCAEPDNLAGQYLRDITMSSYQCSLRAGIRNHEPENCYDICSKPMPFIRNKACSVYVLHFRSAIQSLLMCIFFHISPDFLM